MIRKLYTVIAVILLVTALALFPAPAWADTLPNGLQLAAFEIKTASPPLPGTKVKVEMTLKNLHETPIAFDEETGIFVAARFGDLTDSGKRDFGHGNKGFVLLPGKTLTVKAERVLDGSGNWWFWPGFTIGGFRDPFQRMGQSLYVYASRDEAKREGDVLMVADLLANPARFDQKTVTVKGRAMIVRKQTDSRGRPWNLISFFDMESDKKLVNVFGPGHASIGNGDIVQVTGVFKAKSKRGRYTYDNEIESRSEQIILLEKAKY